MVTKSLTKEKAKILQAELLKELWEFQRQEKLIAPIRKYCPQEPNLKQRLFLSLQPDKDQSILECLFGGAAGGSKSSALLMAALQYVHVPGYSCLILRRDFARLNLAGGLIPRSKSWLHDKAKWRDKEKIWEFDTGPGNRIATIQFGYLENQNDKYRYGSSEYTTIEWDELTEFPEEDYLFMFSRLRMTEDIRKQSNICYRMLSASNPGGRYHDWVKNRFISEEAEEDRKQGILKEVYYKAA